MLEPIDCLTLEHRPRAFRWRGTLYQVTSILNAWCGDKAWRHSGQRADIRFWLVEVRDGVCQFILRRDPDGRWWMLRERVAVELAA